MDEKKTLELTGEELFELIKGLSDSAKQSVLHYLYGRSPQAFLDAMCSMGFADQLPERFRQAEAEKCGRCRQPFDPADRRFDGSARYEETPWCRGCVDRCHESTDFAHACAVCDPTRRVGA